MGTIVPIQLSMSADTFIAFMLLGAAALAFWILVRFETLGPRSVITATCGWAASGALIIGMPALIEGVVSWGLPEARLVVIFGVALPIFTYFFLAGAWFMRAIADLFNSLR